VLQIFVPYKEVLAIYDSGQVNVPGDVTLVWPDDNHGYIRRLSNPAEQNRPGAEAFITTFPIGERRRTTFGWRRSHHR
jgi:hypothetical protein